MLEDLADRGQLTLEADFVVIGGGTIGLPFAVQLARMTGRKVVCLESGGLHQDEPEHPLNEVVHAGTHYEGAAAGRFRCLGGTSTRWGAALIPFQSADMDNAGWPVSFAELEPFMPQVEALFGLKPGPFTDPAFPFDLGDSLVNRLAKWPAFRRRNVVNLVGRDLHETANLSVWINATVTHIRASGPDAPVDIQAQSPGGDVIAVRTPRLIIAAGAIETTRLALLIDRWNREAIGAASPALGRYFADHISVAVAQIAPIRRKALNRIIGFRFEQAGVMRNIRFELAGHAAARATLPPCFAHIGFETARRGGFDALREVLRWLQMRRLPPLRELAGLLRNLPWLIRAVWWRFAERRLLFPQDCRLIVHMVLEQSPDAANRIALSAERTDSFGTPLAEIHWRVGTEDIARLTALTDLFGQAWERSGLSALGTWSRHGDDTIAAGARDSGGIYHPTGSTRMAQDAAQGVVDRDLRLFALPQVQLLSTSVLPTGGGANPTMMALLLAMRCADQHARA